MPLPLSVSRFSKIQIVFVFLVPAYLGSPRKRAVKRVCVYNHIKIGNNNNNNNHLTAVCTGQPR